MPERAGGYIILNFTPKTRPAESLVPRCPPGACKRFRSLIEEMPDRAEEYSVSLEKGDVSVADRGIYKEFSFFFSLLKRKKEAKKEKLTAYPCSERQCITRLAV